MMIMVMIIVDILTAGKSCANHVGCEDDEDDDDYDYADNDERMKLSPVQTKREAMGGGGCGGFIDVLLGFAAEDTCACASCALHGTFQVRLPNTRRCMCLCPAST